VFQQLRKRDRPGRIAFWVFSLLLGRVGQLDVKTLSCFGAKAQRGCQTCMRRGFHNPVPRPKGAVKASDTG